MTPRTKKFSLIAMAFSFAATAAFAAAISDRLKDSVIIGTGVSGTKTLTFDNGSGASDPVISALVSGNTLKMTAPVGVGTTTPLGTLGVADPTGSSDVVVFGTRAGTATGASRWRMLPSTGSSPYFELVTDFGSSPTALKVQAESGNLLTFLHDGKVGIGTTSPSTFLDVTGTTSDTTPFVVRGGTTTGIVRTRLLPSSGAPMFETLADFGASPNVMRIQSDTTALMSLQRSGNVGIGSATPATRLDVGGTFAASGASTFGSTLGVTGTTTFTGTVVANNTTTTNAAVVANSTVTLNSTGGNVPHGCSWQWSSASGGTTQSSVCSAGKAISGGCVTAIANSVAASYPTDSSNTTGQTNNDRWFCQLSTPGTGITAVVFCCSI